jgi:TonB-linked SusC/RagA family outer membrane protein
MRITKTHIFCFHLLLFSLLSFAQETIIKGIVVDETGLSVPGATIKIKNSNNATTTDLDGNYAIKAPNNGYLLVSYIGYNTMEEPINGRVEINFKLTTQSQELQEVVVVGYGTQKKSVITGAISSIKAKDLENLPLTRVEQALQGRSSGLMIASNSGQPGSSATIRVRGITTLGNNEPLWVVDGVVIDAGGIGYLNQSDIESIEVLKDAASQAIYGARAAAGVIMVTTKKGKAGKLSIGYTGYTGFSSAAKKLNLLNATQYATLNNEARAAAGDSILFPNPTSLGAGTDWQDTIFNNNAHRLGHELSLSGGNDVSSYYVSFGLLDQEGIVATDISNYTRKNIRLNSTHKIAKGITFGQTLGYSNEKNIGIGNTNSEFGGPLSSAINLDPITPIVITDPIIANSAPYTNNGIFRDAFGNPYGISNYVGQEMANPIAYIQTRMGNYGWSDNFVGNAYLEIEPIKGLKFRSTLGAKLAYWGGESFTPESYLNSSSIVLKNNISRNTNRGFGWNIENIASYTTTIKDHSFSVLLGQGAYVDNLTRGSSVTYHNIPVTSWGDASFNFNVPQDQIDASAYTGNAHVVSSIFSRVNYDYNQKYLFTGIVRRDGSSRFGSNNKYGVFPSFSLGWVVSKEDFWKENVFVNQLKLRGGYGVTGNDAIGDFRYLATIGGGRNYPMGSSGSITVGNSPNAPSNPDLKWEETSQLNIGFESRIFSDFNVGFDLYSKKTTGILQDILLPGYVGSTGNPVANVADMVNKGFDLELGYKKRIGELHISVNANLSYVKNEVTYLGNGIEFLSGGEGFQSSTYPITRTQVGQAVNSFFGFKTDGIFQNQEEVNAYVNSAGQPIQPNAVPGDFRWTDINGDGQITADDRTFLGSPLPDFSYGLTLNLEYKNFDLLIFGQGVTGNQIFQGLRRLDIANANYQTDALGRWTGEGTSNSFPRLTTNDTNKNFNNPSDFYLEDGDYFRIKTIQLGYTLPNNWIEKVKMAKARVYLTGENLFTFTKYSGFDPEIGGGVMGIDRGFYPQAKTFMMGVNLNF